MAPEALDRLARESYQPELGARPLERYLRRNVETPISRMLLSGELKAGDRLRVTAKADGFGFEVSRR